MGSRRQDRNQERKSGFFQFFSDFLLRFFSNDVIIDWQSRNVFIPPGESLVIILFSFGRRSLDDDES
jgi:hypothetical protein